MVMGGEESENVPFISPNNPDHKNTRRHHTFCVFLSVVLPKSRSVHNEGHSISLVGPNIFLESLEQCHRIEAPPKLNFPPKGPIRARGPDKTPSLKRAIFV